jgi:hypothetical protein
MNREESARVLSSMRDTLKKVYLVAIDEERVSALEAAVGYLIAEDNNVPVKQPDPITGLVPCGGRPAMLFCTSGEGFWVACGGVSQANRYETEEFAIKAWNTAMGYKGGAE